VSAELFIEAAVNDFVKKYGGSVETIIAATKSRDPPKTILDNPMAIVAFNKLQTLVSIESDSDLTSQITTYATVSSVTALKLLEIIADIRKGEFLMNSDIGLYFLGCLNTIITQIHTLPADMVSCTVNLVSKLLAIAQNHSISLGASDRLKECGQQMISTLKAVTVEAVKTPSLNLAQSDLYQSLLYTAILSVNYLGLSLDNSKDQSERLTENSTAQSTSKRNKTFVFLPSRQFNVLNIREGPSLDTPVIRALDSNSPPFEVDEECEITYSGKTIRRLHLADGSGWTSFTAADEEKTVLVAEITDDSWRPPIVIESPHPYRDDSDIYETIQVPDAAGYVITFTSGLIFYRNLS
jgi:hypothetical protein